MAVLCVLQSRLSSSRLPAKAMLSVAGHPMVVLAARRAGNSGIAVAVATSTESEDDVVAATAAGAGVRVVRGPLDDPLARFAIAAADLADEDVVVRMTADNVVPDGELVGLLAGRVAPDTPYVRIGGDDRSLPYGIAGEAFLVSALRAAHEAATDASDREHVTPWIRRTYGDQSLVLPDLPPTWTGLRCTVDTFDDFVRVATLFGSVDDPVATSWRGLCDRLAAQAPAAPLPQSRPNVISQGPLVLGTVQLGLAYGAANAAGLPSAQVAADVLREAARQGLTHLDSARVYGLSERRIGDALGRGLSEHLRVVTKVSPLDEVPMDVHPGFGRAAVFASVERSLRELRTDSVDALLLHRASDWSRPGVREALVELRSDGITRVVGASLSSPDELLALLRDEELGYVQLPFNLLDRRWLADDVQAALAARPDVVVTARSAYLQGLLVAGEAATWPTNAGVVPGTLIAALDGLVAELGRESRTDLCLAWVLGQPWVTSAVVGAENPGQVADSARLASRPPLTADEISRVLAVLPAGSPDFVDPSRWVRP